jgi:hypothetical protein
MNYRANTIGATLNIEALKKKGTVVTCILPLVDNGRSTRRPHAKAAKSASRRAGHLIPAG